MTCSLPTCVMHPRPSAWLQIMVLGHPEQVWHEGQCPAGVGHTLDCRVVTCVVPSALLCPLLPDRQRDGAASAHSATQLLIPEPLA